MDALVGLAGALVGGLLVLIGDFVRQRVEWRREGVRRLFDASMGLAMLYNRMCGEIIDAKRRGVAAGELPREYPERNEAVTGFFMKPGSERLARPAGDLILAYRRLFDGFDDPDFGWEEARGVRREAIERFERAVREVVRQGRV